MIVFMLQYWTTVAIAIVGFSISIISIIVQMRRSRFQQSIDLLYRFEGNFFGKEKQAQRAKAAGLALEGDLSETEPILDFFETIALLTEKGALDEYMVWHTFFYWINNYYEIALPQIATKQKEDAAIWADLAKLVKQLRVRQQKSRSLASAVAAAPSADEMAAFLEKELLEASPNY